MCIGRGTQLAFRIQRRESSSEKRGARSEYFKSRISQLPGDLALGSYCSLLASRYSRSGISSRFAPPERSCFRYTQEQCQREVECPENGQNDEPTEQRLVTQVAQLQGVCATSGNQRGSPESKP